MKPRPQRRIDVLAKRTESCAVACRAIVASKANADAKRTALAALVRYATPKGVQRPGDLWSTGVAALAAAGSAEEPIHHEHVVPVRVLVDRMIAGDDPADVLAVAVVAHVLRSEHQRLGPLVKVHAKLYEEMKTVPVDELPNLGRQRYRNSGLKLTKIPVVRIAVGGPSQ